MIDKASYFETKVFGNLSVVGDRVVVVLEM